MSDTKHNYSPVSFREAAHILQEQFKNHDCFGAIEELNSWSAKDLKELMTKIGQDYKTICKDLSIVLLRDLVSCFVFYRLTLEGVYGRRGDIMRKYKERI